MGSTRQYDFITGVESSALPTAADPVEDDDFMTLGYANANYGAGGGGGSLRWTAPAGKAPLLEEEHNVEVYKFEEGVVQEIWTSIKVPASFVAATQIFMKVPVYSPSTSNNVKMKATCYLIRKETDAIDSTTNSYTSTTGEITLSAPSKEYREIELDLTDADGEINSIDVTGGNILRVKLERDWGSESVSDTEDTRFDFSATEVKFTA